MSELEAFLAQQAAYQSAGRGTFTIDPARQRELLGRLGLLKSELGFLKVAQAAYRAASPELTWTSDTVSITARFEPSLPPREPLWDGEGLGLGILVLSQEYRLEWQWRFDGLEVVGSAGDHRFNESRREVDGQERFVELKITRPGQRWFQRSWPPRVNKLLASRLMCMPMTVSWNGQFLNRRVHLSSKAEAFVLAAPGEAAGLWLAAGTTTPVTYYRCGKLAGQDPTAVFEAAERLEVAQQLGYRGWAALGATGKSWSESIFVLDGVALEGEKNLLDRPGILAIISAAGLSTDLGGMQLVHDAAFRERRDSLAGEVRLLDKINLDGVPKIDFG